MESARSVEVISGRSSGDTSCPSRSRPVAPVMRRRMVVESRSSNWTRRRPSPHRSDAGCGACFAEFRSSQRNSGGAPVMCHRRRSSWHSAWHGHQRLSALLARRPLWRRMHRRDSWRRNRGLFALQLAKLAGFSRVIVSDLELTGSESPRNLVRTSRAGARAILREAIRTTPMERAPTRDRSGGL